MVISASGTEAACSLPPRLEREWLTTLARLKGGLIAERLWELVLTPSERQRLGNDLQTAYTRHRSVVGMWMHLHGVLFPQAVIAVSTRLNAIDPLVGAALLREFCFAPIDPEEAIQWAITQGRLVLRENPRTAYWQGAELLIDWHSKTRCWEFLSALARQAKANGVVDNVTWEMGSKTAPDAIKKRKCRLVNLDGFPLTLADMIISAGRGAYRLNLSAEQIYVFETTSEETIREWTP